MVVGTSSGRGDCGDGKAGRYEIDGYTITLHATNGQTHRLPIYELTEDWIKISGQDYKQNGD